MSHGSPRRAGWHRGWEILSFFSLPSLIFSVSSLPSAQPQTDLTNTSIQSGGCLDRGQGRLRAGPRDTGLPAGLQGWWLGSSGVGPSVKTDPPPGLPLGGPESQGPTHSCSSFGSWIGPRCLLRSRLGSRTGASAGFSGWGFLRAKGRDRRKQRPSRGSWPSSSPRYGERPVAPVVSHQGHPLAVHTLGTSRFETWRDSTCFPEGQTEVPFSGWHFCTASATSCAAVIAHIGTGTQTGRGKSGSAWPTSPSFAQGPKEAAQCTPNPSPALLYA